MINCFNVFFFKIIQGKSIFHFEHIIQSSYRLAVFNMLFCFKENFDSFIVRDFISFNVSKLFTKLFFYNFLYRLFGTLDCITFLRPFVFSYVIKNILNIRSRRLQKSKEIGVGWGWGGGG